MWGIAAVIIVVIGLLVNYSSMSKRQANEAVENYLKTEPEKTSNSTPNTPPTNYSGVLTLTPENTKLAWVGRKTLVLGYEDAGSINISSGKTVIENGKVVSTEAEINMNTIATLNTGKGSDEDKLTKHLKSADFFDVEKYPTATLKITTAKLLSENSGVQNYEFSGTLTMKGITAEVTFPGNVTLSENSAKMEAETKLDRTKWGINFGSSKIANSFIDDYFTLKISINAITK